MDRSLLIPKLLLGALVIVAGLTVAPAPAATPDEISQWVAELNSDLYVVRERAMRNLAQAGPDAIDQLAVAADDRNLEVATRAVRLLLEMTESDDLDQSVAVLERVARLKNRPVERNAAEAMLQGMREKKAVAEIKELGGIEKSPYMVDSQRYLGHLHLGEKWKGGDQGLRLIKNLSYLQILEVHGIGVTDAGVEHLHDVDTLVELQLYGTKVSPEAVARLRAALPNTNVQYRKGALLGVRGSPDQVVGGAHILDVQPDSAAAAAGIQPNDVITAFNGQPVQNFTDLTDHIAGFKPGDKATLEVTRGEEKLTKKVEFGKWGAAE